MYFLLLVVVVKDLWKNIKAMSSSPMLHELLQDLNILPLIRAFSQHYFDGQWDLVDKFFFGISSSIFKLGK